MKRTPLRSRSKTPAAKLKRKADALWSLAIRSAGACAMGEWYLDEYYELASCPGAKTTLERLESLITNAARSGKDTP